MISRKAAKNAKGNTASLKEPFFLAPFAPWRENFLILFPGGAESR